MYVHEDQGWSVAPESRLWALCPKASVFVLHRNVSAGLSSPPLKHGRLFAMETRPAFAESRALFGLRCFRCFQQSVWYRSLMLQTASGRVVAFNILWNICPHDWEETEPPPQARPSPILPVHHPLFCQLLIQKNSAFSILLTACCSNQEHRGVDEC